MPDAPVVTNPVAAGNTTSEGKGTKVLVIIASIIAGLGTIQTALESLTAVVPPAAKGLGLYLAIGGAVVGAVLQIVYTVQRGLIKVAAIQAGQVPPADPQQAPKGFGLVGLVALIFVATALLVLAVPARAQDPGPKFGGCLKNGTTCLGPTVNVNVLAISLKTGDVTTQFSPGIGYGVTWHTDQWYKYGLSTGFALRSYNDALKAQVSLTGSFAEYVRIGIAGVFGAGKITDTAALLVAFGSDFGSTPAAAK